jgi:hypothetical protein
MRFTVWLMLPLLPLLLPFLRPDTVWKLRGQLVMPGMTEEFAEFIMQGDTVAYGKTRVGVGRECVYIKSGVRVIISNGVVRSVEPFPFNQ